MGSLRTLIVDDSAVMRKIVERSLRQAGIELTEVIEAGNGSEALDIMRHRSVDLVLSDINMPVMDGLEFVKQLRDVENAKGVPVVMITTEGSESHVVEAISCGARGLFRILIAIRVAPFRRSTLRGLEPASRRSSARACSRRNRLVVQALHRRAFVSALGNRLTARCRIRAATPPMHDFQATGKSCR